MCCSTVRRGSARPLWRMSSPTSSACRSGRRQGPCSKKPGDLAAILTNLKEHEVLFIDEIHRMSPVIEEILYPAMEDYELDIVIGQGPGAAVGQGAGAAVHV